MTYSAIARPLLIALVVAASFGAILVREATSPSGAGYWTPMVAGPNGTLLVADEPGRQLVALDAGGVHRVAAAPAAIYRGLAGDGQNLLLGTESGLFVSNDLGRHWTFPIRGRRVTAVALGEVWFAAAWDDGIYRSTDSGATWTKGAMPPGDTQVFAVDGSYAATLLGVLRTDDGGESWTAVPGIPNRVTAVDGSGGYGDWHGDVVTAGKSYRLPGGVWSLAGDLVGTTSGLWLDGRRVNGELGSREVTGVLDAGGRYYAAVARRGVYVSDDGLDWRLLYQP